jgi:crotonobetaine/carnitine-CoA ligase
MVWTELPAAGAEVEPYRAEPGDVVAILHTSGTTGPSKGVCCLHAQFYWWGVTTAAALGVGEDDVLSSSLPLFHTNALNTFVQALVHRARYVVAPRFSASRFWDRLAESEATVTYIIGAMAAMIANQPPSAADRGHRVRTILAPGTPAPLWPVFEERFGVTLVEGHGMTETNMAIGPRDGAQRPGWMGRTLAGFEARVFDEHDVEVPTGTAGELVLRAEEPCAFASGYWRQPEETQRAWRNFWFHSGDRVVQDEEGYFRFIDRLKDAIRRRGENISAWEVEQVVVQHDRVANAAAVAVPSELGEDEVMVFVVPHDNFADPVDLIRHCEPQLAYYAVPRFVEFVAELPLTANGKVSKAQLRDRGVSQLTWDRERAGYKLKRQ